MADITNRKRANEVLRHSEEHLRLIIDTIPTMAWTVRPDGAVDFINQRWLDYTGLSFEEEIEEPTRPVHPQDLPRVMEKWQADMSAGEPYEDEMRLRRADGTYRWFLVRTVPLRDDLGNIVKWFGTSTDIEDRKTGRRCPAVFARRIARAGCPPAECSRRGKDTCGASDSR